MREYLYIYIHIHIYVYGYLYIYIYIYIYISVKTYVWNVWSLGFGVQGFSDMATLGTLGICRDYEDIGGSL